jgi:hypothetical protein
MNNQQQITRPEPRTLKLSSNLDTRIRVMELDHRSLQPG